MKKLLDVKKFLFLKTLCVNATMLIIIVNVIESFQDVAMIVSLNIIFMVRCEAT